MKDIQGCFVLLVPFLFTSEFISKWKIILKVILARGREEPPREQYEGQVGATAFSQSPERGRSFLTISRGSGIGQPGAESCQPTDWASPSQEQVPLCWAPGLPVHGEEKQEGEVGAETGWQPTLHPRDAPGKARVQGGGAAPKGWDWRGRKAFCSYLKKKKTQLSCCRGSKL